MMKYATNYMTELPDNSHIILHTSSLIYYFTERGVAYIERNSFHVQHKIKS